jgi:hypothetical protein
MRPIPTLATLSVVTAYGALQVLGRHAGSTAAERQVGLPGDELVANPQLVTNHAITVRAHPEEVWPWLCQMGWHLGGYYTPPWVDALLFPENWHSLDRLDPTLVRDLQVGDIIPDGKPGTAHYVVTRVEAPSLLLAAVRHSSPTRLGREVRRAIHVDLVLQAHRPRRRLDPSPPARARA